MPGILAITILFFLYALSEIIALRSNAVLSTVLGISVILTIGFGSISYPRISFNLPIFQESEC